MDIIKLILVTYHDIQAKRYFRQATMHNAKALRIPAERKLASACWVESSLHSVRAKYITASI